MKYIEFYKHLDKKLGNGLSIAVLIVVVLFGSSLITFLGSFKPESPLILIFPLSILFMLLGLILVWLVYLLISSVYKWVVNEVLPAFRETQVEFKYTPTDKAKVKFE